MDLLSWLLDFKGFFLIDYSIFALIYQIYPGKGFLLVWKTYCLLSFLSVIFE